MKMKNSKFITALLLVFALATATSASLFASTADGAQVQAFRAQVVEILDEMRADWVIEDLELLMEFEVLGDDEFLWILEVGAQAALEFYLTPTELEAFWALDVPDRFWFLFDNLLSLDLWMDWSDWDWGWDDDWYDWDWDDWGWDDWDWDDDWFWSDQFSGVWREFGQALRFQLVDLFGYRYASWIMEDLDWDRDFMGEDLFFEILSLNLMDFLAEHMTEEELYDFLAMEYDERYSLFWDIFSVTHLDFWDNWDWDDWDWGWDDDWSWQPSLSPIWENEGAALMAQLIELLGEDRAAWLAEDLDWWLELGRIMEDTWAEILAMDVMAAMETRLPAGYLDEFFNVDYRFRQWTLWDYVFMEIIFEGWGDISVTREDVVAALEVIAHEYLTYDDFDMVALLALADMDMDDLTDMFYFLLTMDDGTALWLFMDWGADWLYSYLDDFFWSLSRESETEALNFLQMYVTYIMMMTILEDDFWAFFSLRVFDDVMNAVGFGAFYDVFFDGNQGMVDALNTYGTELLEMLDFRLYDALSELFAEDGQWTVGLILLDSMLGGLLSDNMDSLYDYYTMPPFVSCSGTGAATVNFWNFLEDWQYIILADENLEERLVFDVTMGTEFALDFFNVTDAHHLNLFYSNLSDSEASLVVEFSGRDGFEERVLQAAAGGSAAMQITVDELDGGTNMVWVMIVNTQWDEIDGEFALRLTQYPLE